MKKKENSSNAEDGENKNQKTLKPTYNNNNDNPQKTHFHENTESSTDRERKKADTHTNTAANRNLRINLLLATKCERANTHTYIFKTIRKIHRPLGINIITLHLSVMVIFVIKIFISMIVIKPLKNLFKIETA